MEHEQIIEKLNNIETILTDGSNQLMTFDETCGYLHFKPSYLYKLTAKKLIPFYQPSGKKLYFYKHELDEWIMGKYGRKTV